MQPLPVDIYRRRYLIAHSESGMQLVIAKTVLMASGDDIARHTDLVGSFVAVIAMCEASLRLLRRGVSGLARGHKAQSVSHFTDFTKLLDIVIGQFFGFFDEDGFDGGVDFKCGLIGVALGV